MTSEVIKGLLCGFVFASSVFMTLVAIGASVKTVQWIGKRLGVKPLDLA